VVALDPISQFTALADMEGSSDRLRDCRLRLAGDLARNHAQFRGVARTPSSKDFPYYGQDNVALNPAASRKVAKVSARMLVMVEIWFQPNREWELSRRANLAAEADDFGRGAACRIRR